MLNHMLARSVAASPAKDAIVQGERRVSYGALDAMAGRLAGLLLASGVGAGDTVAVVLPNGAEFVAALFAIARVRAVMLPLNPEYPREELQRFLADRPARLVITDAAHEMACVAVAGDARVRRAEDAQGCPPLAGADDSYAGDALYLYTSGSTDSNKRVCCTQANLHHEAHNFVQSTGLTAGDTILCTIPFHHSYGLGNCLLDAAYTGATLVLEPDTSLPFAARHETMLALLRTETVRVYPGVPFQFDVLSKSAADVGAAFRDVTWCISSGDVLPRRTFDRFLSRTGHPIRSLYGSTEAASIAMDTGPAAQVRFGSIGAPLKNVTVEVRGGGHLWVKSPTMPPRGYDDQLAGEGQTFVDGFYDTGDIGRFDARGQLIMTGRKQSFLDVGGHKVDVAEVEEVLLAHPKVREAAVVGVEVAKLGAMLKAVVAADESCREADVLDHCRAHLAKYKIPRWVEFRELLPRSPLGKVLRKELTDATTWSHDVPSARDVPRVPRRQQQEWLAARINEQVATILRCDPSTIPTDVPFQSLGFDSLRAVELQERLSQMSGVALSITTLWNYPSIGAYAAFLLDAIEGPAVAAPREHPVEGSEPPAAADSLDGFSDEEIAAMLAEELGGRRERGDPR